MTEDKRQHLVDEGTILHPLVSIVPMISPLSCHTYSVFISPCMEVQHLTVFEIALQMVADMYRPNTDRGSRI